MSERAWSKFGRNGVQVATYLASLPNLDASRVGTVLESRRTVRYRQASEAAHKVGLSAAVDSAVDSAFLAVWRSVFVPQLLPTQSTAERFDVNSFSSALEQSVFALAKRPSLGDETTADLVDLISSPMHFNWRSWGIGECGEVGVTPEWALARTAQGASSKSTD